MAEEVNKKTTSTGLPENTEAALCYLFGWVSGLIFFLLEKDNKKIRFHALQSIVLFGGINLIYIVLNIFTFGLATLLMPLLSLLVLVYAIYLIVKVYKGEEVTVPLVTEFVKKQLK